MWLVSVEEGLKWMDQHSVPRAFAERSQTRLTLCKDASALSLDTATLVISHVMQIVEIVKVYQRIYIFIYDTSYFWISLSFLFQDVVDEEVKAQVPCPRRYGERICLLPFFRL